MFKFQTQLSASIRILAVLVAVSIIHTLGEILGGLWIVSDLLLILGAYTTYKLIRSQDLRDELLEGVKGDFNVDGIAKWILTQVFTLVSSFGVDTANLVSEEDVKVEESK